MGSIDYFLNRPNLENDDRWQMLEGDRAVLELFLSKLEPEHYAEIGVYFGGSLLLASNYATRVTGIDIEDVSSRFKLPKNAELLIGNSKDLIPRLFHEEASEHPSLILVDGDHKYEHVQGDIWAIAKSIEKETIVLCHDTANAEVRKALIDLYKSCRNIVAMDLDASNGILISEGGGKGETWGGLGVLKLMPGNPSKQFENHRMNEMLHGVWTSERGNDKSKAIRKLFSRIRLKNQR